MAETTAQRTARLLSMTNAQLIMHAKDLTLERDTLLAALKKAREKAESMPQGGYSARSELLSDVRYILRDAIDTAEQPTQHNALRDDFYVAGGAA